MQLSASVDDVKRFMQNYCANRRLACLMLHRVKSAFIYISARLGATNHLTTLTDSTNSESCRNYTSPSPRIAHTIEVSLRIRLTSKPQLDIQTMSFIMSFSLQRVCFCHPKAS